jgi:hypothetical protein
LKNTQIFSVRQLSDRHPGFSEGSLRWLIHQSIENGLAQSGALVRNGRRVLIDEQRFLDWVRSR